jgi:hypothetical protein
MQQSNVIGNRLRKTKSQRQAERNTTGMKTRKTDPSSNAGTAWEKGHFSSKCPKKKKDKESQAGEGLAHATWQEEMEHSMFCTVCEYTVNNAVNVTQSLKTNKLLLDNQADISIVNPVLLENVRPAEREIKIKGVGGIQLQVNQVGDLPGFFTVYASKETRANVLSFADVEGLYVISYVQKEAFVVHMPSGDLVFSRREKLYIAELEEANVGIVQATVRENEALYTKDELNRAKEAYQFLKNSGYPSASEATHLLTDGNVRKVPMLMRADIDRAYKIYGIHPEYVRGKLMKGTVGCMQVDPTLCSVSKTLKVYVDVMHVDTKKFLVSV